MIPGKGSPDVVFDNPSCDVYRSPSNRLLIQTFSLKTSGLHIPSPRFHWAPWRRIGKKARPRPLLFYDTGHCRSSARRETPGMRQPQSTLSCLMVSLCTCRNSRAFLEFDSGGAIWQQKDFWRREEEHRVFFITEGGINSLSMACIGISSPLCSPLEVKAGANGNKLEYYFLLWTLKEFQRETGRLMIAYRKGKK